MAYEIPSTMDVQRLLLKLKQAELVVLSEQSGVPMGTLIKIRHCVTKNPGIETVRKIVAAPALKWPTAKRGHKAAGTTAGKPLAASELAQPSTPTKEVGNG